MRAWVEDNMKLEWVQFPRYTCVDLVDVSLPGYTTDDALAVYNPNMDGKVRGAVGRTIPDDARVFASVEEARAILLAEVLLRI